MVRPLFPIIFWEVDKIIGWQISEVTPRGREFLFFSLFGVIGKTSSFLGPFISSAIIDHSHNRDTSSAFYFLMPLSLVSAIILIIGVDVQKSQREQDKFLTEEQAAKEHIEKVYSLARALP